MTHEIDGFELAGKKEVLWLKVKEKTEQIIADTEISLEINKEILKYAEKKINELAI